MSNTIEAPILLTEQEAASYLDIGLSTLRRWRHLGKAPSHYRVGSILRYRKEVLDAFIHEHEQTEEMKHGKER